MAGLPWLLGYFLLVTINCLQSLALHYKTYQNKSKFFPYDDPSNNWIQRLWSQDISLLSTYLSYFKMSFIGNGFQILHPSHLPLVVPNVILIICSSQQNTVTRAEDETVWFQPLRLWSLTNTLWVTLYAGSHLMMFAHY